MDIRDFDRGYSIIRQQREQEAIQESEIDSAFFWGWLLGVLVTSACWLLALWTHIIQVVK